MPIKNETMRDIPKRPIIDRLRSRGLIGGLFPSGEDELIAQAFQQFREGREPVSALPEQEALIGLPGAEPIMFPSRAATPGIQPQDLAKFRSALIGSGPEGIALAKQLEGKAAPSPFAKINPKDFTQESVDVFQRTNDFSKLKAQKDPSGTGDRIFNRESKLRGEFTKASGDFTKVRDSFARVEASSINPSAAGDLSMVFNYMKMLDPGSVVRESEFATAAATGSWGERIKAAGSKMLRGERLSDVMRDDFVNRASKLWGRQTSQHDKRKIQFRKLSKRAGVDSRNVVIDIGLADAPQLDGSDDLTPEEKAELDSLRARRGR